MSDTVLAALIGVGGATLVAIVSAIVQAATTRYVIRAEHKRTLDQIGQESQVRREERRPDRLVEALAEILTAADPDISPDYSRVVQLIHRLQLLLDARAGTDEGRLAGTLSNLGFKVQAYIAAHSKNPENIDLERRDLLTAHAEVQAIARTVLAPRVQAAGVGSTDPQRRLTAPLCNRSQLDANDASFQHTHVCGLPRGHDGAHVCSSCNASFSP